MSRLLLSAGFFCLVSCISCATTPDASVVPSEAGPNSGVVTVQEGAQPVGTTPSVNSGQAVTASPRLAETQAAGKVATSPGSTSVASDITVNGGGGSKDAPPAASPNAQAVSAGTPVEQNQGGAQGQDTALSPTTSNLASPDGPDAGETAPIKDLTPDLASPAAPPPAPAPTPNQLTATPAQPVTSGPAQEQPPSFAKDSDATPASGEPVSPDTSSDGAVQLTETSLPPTLADAANPAPGETLMVVCSGLNVRRGPGMKFGVVRVLPRGASVSVEGREGIWVRIGDEQYVSSRYLAPTQAQSTGH